VFYLPVAGYVKCSGKYLGLKRMESVRIYYNEDLNVVCALVLVLPEGSNLRGYDGLDFGLQ
jgi:hypothetical protein